MLDRKFVKVIEDCINRDKAVNITIASECNDYYDYSMNHVCSKCNNIKTYIVPKEIIAVRKATCDLCSQVDSFATIHVYSN